MSRKTQKRMVLIGPELQVAKIALRGALDVATSRLFINSAKTLLRRIEQAQDEKVRA